MTNKSSGLCVSVLTAMLCVSVLGAAHGEVIWSNVALLDESSFDNSGTLVQASNFGKNNFAVTVNGIPFAEDNTVPSGFVTCTADNLSTTFSDPIDTLLNGCIGGFSAASFDVSTVAGRNYRLQIPYDNDINNFADNSTVTILGVTSPSLGDLEDEILVAEFTATGSATTITFNGNSSGDHIVQALALHDLGAVPEPGTFGLMGAALLAAVSSFGLRRSRQRRSCSP